jgi:hypothetical protein
MPADHASAADRGPRRARYLIPLDLPHRAEIVAALSMLALLTHLLLAQATLVLAVAFHAVSRVSRWRPQWLLVPAAAGLGWLLAIGPGAALAGLAAGPRGVIGALAAHVTGQARLAGLAGALPRWLAGQLPAALILAAAEAAVAWWLRWLHTDEWDVPPARPGLAALGRGLAGAAQVRSGGVLTRDGFSLGVDRRTGRLAAVTWREAAGGMLVTGASWAAVAAVGSQVVQGAVRRRKPVIAVDLAGDPGFAASLTAACAAAGAPLQVFGPAGAGHADGAAAGPGYYEPLQGGSPARKASLVTGLIDWTGRPEAARRDWAAVLTDIFALAAAAPAGPAVAVLDDVISLLEPAALRSRLARVPPYHPRRGALAGRVRASAARLESDPGSAAAVAGQLAGLRAAPLGQQLAAGPPAGRAGTRISLAGVVRDRGVALFPLGRSGRGRPAEMIATLVALDAAGLFADLHRTGAAGDGLVWFGRCEGADPAALAALLAAGAQAGLACVLGTTSPRLAGWLAGQVRVVAAHRLADPGLAALIAPLTGTRLARAPGVPGLADGAAAPTAALAGPAGAVAGPAGAVAGPAGALAGPAGALAGPAGALAGPGAAAALGPAVLSPGPVPVAPGPGTPGTAGLGTGGSPGGMVAGPATAPAAQPAASLPTPPGGVGAPGLPLGVVRCPVVPAAALCALRDGELTLIAGGPGGRVVPLVREVPARIPQPRPVRPARLARLAAGHPGTPRDGGRP